MGSPVRAKQNLAAILFAASALGLFPAARTAASEVQASVAQGEALVRFADGDEWISLGEGAPLEPGDRVRVPAGGRVELVTPEGDVLEIQEESELEVEASAPKDRSLRLALGGLLAKLLPDPEKKFRVRTPLAVAAVRGTEFGLDVSAEGATEVGVAEGAVAFQALDEKGEPRGEELRVPPQEGAEVRPGKGPQRLQRWPARAKRRLARMALLREAAPRLRERWKDLPPETRRELRQKLRRRWQELSPDKKQRLLRTLRRRWKDSPGEDRRRPRSERRRRR